MIFKSYLVYPHEGQRTQLEKALRSLPACEVISATNRNLLVLVTESSDDAADKALVAQIENLASLRTLTLVYGHNETVALDE